MVSDEVYEEIRACIDGRLSLEELRSWLDDHLQEILDLHDGALLALVGQAFSILAEFRDGYRTEGYARDDLSRLLAPPTTANTFVFARPTTTATNTRILELRVWT